MLIPRSKIIFNWIAELHAEKVAEITVNDIYELAGALEDGDLLSEIEDLPDAKKPVSLDDVVKSMWDAAPPAQPPRLIDWDAYRRNVREALKGERPEWATHHIVSAAGSGYFVRNPSEKNGQWGSDRAVYSGRQETDPDIVANFLRTKVKL